MTHIRYETRELDEHVVAWGLESDSPAGRRLWIASEWSAHPLENDDAEHLRHLCVDATRAELGRQIRMWRGDD